MQLLEVMVAATVFSAAAGSSLQLWSQAASGTQRSEQREQLQERIELDRLQLAAHWRRALQPDQACAVDQNRLLSVAAVLPVPPQLQRQVLADPTSGGVLVRWSAGETPAIARERLFTLAGLGLSCPTEVQP